MTIDKIDRQILDQQIVCGTTFLSKNLTCLSNWLILFHGLSYMLYLVKSNPPYPSINPIYLFSCMLVSFIDFYMMSSFNLSSFFNLLLSAVISRAILVCSLIHKLAQFPTPVLHLPCAPEQSHQMCVFTFEEQNC